MRFTIMCGIPNSGKTMKSRELSDKTGAVLIRLDDYTHLYMKGYKPYQVVELAINDIRSNLESGHDVIYDAVNETTVGRQQILEAVSTTGADIVCVYMATPASVCISRDSSGWSAHYAEIFEPPTESEGFDELIVCSDGVGEVEPTEQNILDVLLGVIE